MLYLTVPNLHFPVGISHVTNVIILQKCFPFAHSPTLQIVLYALEVILYKTNNTGLAKSSSVYSISFSGKNPNKHFGQPNIIGLHTSIFKKLLEIKITVSVFIPHISGALFFL